MADTTKVRMQCYPNNITTVSKTTSTTQVYHINQKPMTTL